jgi:acetyl-CoA carboxylase biotin carboxylase subunit
MIKKILVANRGEIAMRIFRTCRVMNIPTVAIYTHVDRGALHVRYAEEAYCISENEADTSYLKPDLILEIARKTGAAIHPGYGFLSENAAFARRCEQEGIIFIGPDADIIARMGLKTEARKIMQSAGVPIIPGTQHPLSDPEETRLAARRTGYPIMLKASAGGGGKGMRLVRNENELETACRLARSEAANAFGDDSIYIEKYIENPHHIEVQILGDKYGNLIHLYERECSIQRRHQKIIEESPSPFLREETRRKLLSTALEACRKIGYYSVGTLEFIVDQDQRFYFLEMNTRLQVEHPVTEACTGVDLVRDMILIASGHRLPYRQNDIEFRGAAIECRIYAEDPANNFLPSPGIIKVREAPEGRNIRLDSAAYAGFEVSLHYDPMIAKLCSWGRNRASAIANMTRALREYKILGIKTTIPFHLSVLHNSAFLRGIYDTTFIDTKFNKEDLLRKQNSDPTVAIIAAVLKCHEEEKAAAARATTQPAIGESLWKHYGKLQMTANNF